MPITVNTKTKYIYAIDFDGTIAVSEYPKILGPIKCVIDTCKKLKEEGHILILWTCRRGRALQEAIAFCEEQGLTFDYINENVPEIIEFFGSDTRKIFADYYLDDRAVNVSDMIGDCKHHA
jgi:hydroxymethylpyrimidine pyrophosphatase-like HAD family hydrolase